MARVVINYEVMEEKANLLETGADKIRGMYDDMLVKVKKISAEMEAEALETAVEKFANMEDNFETIMKDIKEYAEFLKRAAEAYRQVDEKNMGRASEQGGVFG